MDNQYKLVDEEKKAKEIVRGNDKVLLNSLPPIAGKFDSLKKSYTKKIDAIVYEPDKGLEDGFVNEMNGITVAYIKSIEGRKHVEPGDYIIDKGHGRYDVLKPEVFDRMYGGDGNRLA